MRLRRRALLRRLRATTPATRCDCLRAAAERGRRARRAVRHQRRLAAAAGRARRGAVVRARWPTACAWASTCHDDSGCAVANTLAAVEAGATQVQGTINGIGERTGNANLVTIIANLQLKMGAEVLAPERLARLTETAHFVDELLNRAPDPAQPYVGKHAFAHKGGMHAAGVRADARDLRARRPGARRQRRDVLISELSGKGDGRREGAPSRGPRRSDDARRRAASSSASRSSSTRGFQFEAADGSFELLMRKEAGEYEPLFRLESWRVLVEKRADGKVETEATIKIWLDGERYVRTAEGNGPVHALDAALRDAIGEIHPHLRDIELVNFKVRILDETKGTDAVTRVLHRRLRRPRRVGLDRRLGEPDRGLLGRARGLAGVRDAAGPQPARAARSRAVA